MSLLPAYAMKPRRKASNSASEGTNKIERFVLERRGWDLNPRGSYAGLREHRMIVRRAFIVRLTLRISHILQKMLRSVSDNVEFKLLCTPVDPHTLLLTTNDDGHSIGKLGYDKSPISCSLLDSQLDLHGLERIFYSREPMAFSTSTRISHDLTSSFILLWSG